MEKVNRLEIIVGSPFVENLLDFFDKKKISGYSIIDRVKGRGNRGLYDAEGLTDTFNNSYILLACSDEELELLSKPLKTYLDRVGGICLVSDAHWIKK